MHLPAKYNHILCWEKPEIIWWWKCTLVLSHASIYYNISWLWWCLISLVSRINKLWCIMSPCLVSNDNTFLQTTLSHNSLHNIFSRYLKSCRTQMTEITIYIQHFLSNIIGGQHFHPMFPVKTKNNLFNKTYLSSQHPISRLHS